MGDPKHGKKSYVTPSHPWQGVRIQAEKKIKSEFGLKNKKEIWKAMSEVRNYRRQARDLIGDHREKSKPRKEVLINMLARKGILQKGATLDDVLALETQDILERRLQTIVFKKGIATTQKGARQLILHGHVAIDGKKHTAPGTIIEKELETKITYIGPAQKPPELRKPKKKVKEGASEPSESGTSKETAKAAETTKEEKPIEVEKKPAEKAKSKEETKAEEETKK